jgi:hypothetical protein
MEADKYHGKKAIIIGTTELKRFAIIFLALVFIGFFIPFYFIWDYQSLRIGFTLFLKYLLLLLVPIIIVHEGLHGIIWAISAPSGFRTIKFGFNMVMLSPYTHCNEPLKKWKYIAGAMAPFIITGIIPAIYAFLAGNGFWLFLAAFCTWSSAGDILSCCHAFKADANAYILDHPDNLGFYVIDHL